ncbi:MAG: alanine racemase [Planctomycetota bacterium]
MDFLKDTIPDGISATSLTKARTWVVIDLGKVKRNIKKISQNLSGHVRIMAVVKANAYGHGAVQVGKAALKTGATMLGVGDSTEAIELREACIDAPILILGAICDEEIEALIDYQISCSVHSLERIRLLNKEAERRDRTLTVNVNIDTGMGRLGVKPENAIDLITEVMNSSHLSFFGISTHFSCAHFKDKSFSYEQLNKFSRVINEIYSRGIRIPRIHAANSAALFSMPDSHFDMVRPGAAIYGVDPGNLSEYEISLEPVLTWKTQITYWKWVEEGTPIGYNMTYRAQRKSKIATLPVGYNDGYSFALSNTSEVLYKGKRCRVVGNVTMDYIMIDVTEIPEVHVGAEVTLLGREGEEEITSAELGRIKGASPHETTCLLGRRVKRYYIDSTVNEPAMDKASAMELNYCS